MARDLEWVILRPSVVLGRPSFARAAEPRPCKSVDRAGHARYTASAGCSALGRRRRNLILFEAEGSLS
jgi:hypothetical protein